MPSEKFAKGGFIPDGVPVLFSGPDYIIPKRYVRGALLDPDTLKKHLALRSTLSLDYLWDIRD